MKIRKICAVISGTLLFGALCVGVGWFVARRWPWDRGGLEPGPYLLVILAFASFGAVVGLVLARPGAPPEPPSPPGG